LPAQNCQADNSAQEFVRAILLDDGYEGVSAMATTLKDLQDEIDAQQAIIDNAREILEDAYSPESTRATLVAAVSEALDVLSGEEEEEDEGEDDDADEE
jgi:hypothetical protein